MSLRWLLDASAQAAPSDLSLPDTLPGNPCEPLQLTLQPLHGSAAASENFQDARFCPQSATSGDASGDDVQDHHDVIDKLMQSMDGAGIVAEFIIRVLGLTNCADTPLGNEMIRGVSGGERKRVTLGEMLVGNKVQRPSIQIPCSLFIMRQADLAEPQH